MVSLEATRAREMGTNVRISISDRDAFYTEKNSPRVERRGVVLWIGLVHLSPEVRVEAEGEELDEETRRRDLYGVEVDLLRDVVNQIFLQFPRKQRDGQRKVPASPRKEEGRTPGMGIASGMEAKLERVT